MLPIASLYIPCFGIILLFLSFNVIRERRSSGVALGTPVENKKLFRASRAHGNFTEYVPIILLLLVVAELNGSSYFLLHLTYIVTLAARILHAYGITKTEEVFTYRVTGMILTFSCLLVASALALF